MIDDRGKNSYRTRRYEATRGALAAAIPATTRPRLFLRRGTLGAANRKLINEAAVEAFLAARGFHALTPESMGADEVLRAVRGAEVIVSVEGSACAHAVHALSPRGTLVVLQPPYRFVTNHKDELDCIGANYAFVVGVPEADGFSVPTDDLGRTLDLVDRRVRPA
jgi:capsular polysaccharide biosynthesis protein